MKNLIRIMLFTVSVAILSSVSACTEVKQEPQFDNQAFDNGKYVGRNAMIIYIGRKTKDTLRIELIELLNLEDSLSAVMNNKNK